MIIADFHAHSSFSADSSSPMEDMVQGALSKGLSCLCFTDHMDYDYPKEYAGRFEFEVPAYFARTALLKEAYDGRIHIRTGIELGMQPHLGEAAAALLSSHPFDFVICSSHLSQGMDPYYPLFWEKRSVREAVSLYYSSILSNLEAFTDFDVYGHLDYIIRYIPDADSRAAADTYRDYAGILDEILCRIIQCGKGIEVNSAGYRYALGHANPHAAILKRYLELGGSLITIGSDAHRPEDLACDFEKTREMLLSLGFRSYAVYENRIPSLLPL